MDIIRYDYDTVAADGSDNITATLLELLNEYPLLAETSVGEIKFQILDSLKGIAMFANPSVAVLTERVSVTEHIEQKCAYAFTIVYRIRQSTDNKERIKEWLDKLGRWLERQTITDGDTVYKLFNYPALDDGKAFESIKRTSQAYLYNTTEDKGEDWAISMQATYSNSFDRN